MSLSREEVVERLRRVRGPDMQSNIVDLGMVKEIAQAKMQDLNCTTIEAAMKMVEGSARSMGLEVKG